jgi:hypothetical protein
VTDDLDLSLCVLTAYLTPLSVPWLRQLVTGLSPRRHGFDPGSVHMGFVVDKVTLGQVFPRVLRFSPVNFIPPVLHYTEKRIKLFIITVLHNKPAGCRASVASAAEPVTTKKNYAASNNRTAVKSSLQRTWKCCVVSRGTIQALARRDGGRTTKKSYRKTGIMA